MEEGGGILKGVEGKGYIGEMSKKERGLQQVQSSAGRSLQQALQSSEC